MVDLDVSISLIAASKFGFALKVSLILWLDFSSFYWILSDLLNDFSADSFYNDDHSINLSLPSLCWFYVRLHFWNYRWALSGFSQLVLKVD